MSSEALPAPPVTSGDRLGLTMFLATVIHGIAILGISFTVSAVLNKTPPSLDVVLVQTSSEDEPEKAEHIAQANQQASGRTDEKSKPSSPLSSRVPLESQGLAPMAVQPKVALKSQSLEDKILTQAESDLQVLTDELLKKPEKSIVEQEVQAQRALEIARLAAELAEEERQFAERPRISYMDTLSAKTAVEAAYVKAWIDKVERMGNLNYPDEARRDKLSGSLILSVLMDTNGDVLKVEVGSSSGHQALDDAATRIVKLAAPFNKFPAEMAESYDQMMITRTWIFESDYRLGTK